MYVAGTLRPKLSRWQTLVVMGPDSRGACHRARIRATRWLGRDDEGWYPRPTISRDLSHHAGTESGLAPRRLDFLLQETMRLLADISGPRKGPGATLVLGVAGRLADLIAVAGLEFETAEVAAGPVDRGLDRPVSRLDHARAADTGDAAFVLHPSRHRAFEPADRTGGRVGRVVEAPGPAAPVALAQHRTVSGVPRFDRRTQIVSAGTVEIGLGVRLSRAQDGRKARHDQENDADQPHLPHPGPRSSGKGSCNRA